MIAKQYTYMQIYRTRNRVSPANKSTDNEALYKAKYTGATTCCHYVLAN